MTKQQAHLVDVATRALLDDDFEREAGFCQRYVRQVVQEAIGAQFDEYWRSTAEKTRRAFVGTAYYHVHIGNGEEGDLLYYAGSQNQTAGHVAIHIGGGLLAQNSVTDAWDKATGHKGTRKLSTMRAPSAIVRLWR